MSTPRRTITKRRATVESAATERATFIDTCARERVRSEQKILCRSIDKAMTFQQWSKEFLVLKRDFDALRARYAERFGRRPTKSERDAFEASFREEWFHAAPREKCPDNWDFDERWLEDALIGFIA